MSRITKKYLKYVASPACVGKLIVLRVLAEFHEYTKYCHARSFSDLFYWPDGPCMDMAVVFGLIAVACCLLYETIYTMIRIFVEDAHEEEFPECIEDELGC